MMPKQLKDLDLARCAFIEYHGPIIPFEALNQDYQMRWVRVARAVVQGQRAYTRSNGKDPDEIAANFIKKAGIAGPIKKKRKWSAATLKKFRATMKAKREARNKSKYED